MTISDKVTAALQEVRILILGSEILLGFQFHAVFQPGFKDLPGLNQVLDGLACCLMLLAAILLISPGSFHRLAESGNDTLRLHRVTTVVAALALLPFASCLGIDVFVVGAKLAGAAIGFLVAAVLTLLALAAWFGIEIAQRQVARRRKEDIVVKTSIKEKITTLGTEIRVVLPGAQALLGFQFSAFLSDTFDKLSLLDRTVHFACVVAMTIAVILLMAPAAYHRLATGGEDTREVDRFGSFAMLGAMVFLILSMAGDLYVVLEIVFQSSLTSALAAVAAVCLALALWFVFPIISRRHNVHVG
jgi:hypothetical protein